MLDQDQLISAIIADIVNKFIDTLPDEIHT
jgi:hypothetical protein